MDWHTTVSSACTHVSTGRLGMFTSLLYGILCRLLTTDAMFIFSCAWTTSQSALVFLISSGEYQYYQVFHKDWHTFAFAACTMTSTGSLGELNIFSVCGTRLYLLILLDVLLCFIGTWAVSHPRTFYAAASHVFHMDWLSFDFSACTWTSTGRFGCMDGVNTTAGFSHSYG